MSRLVAQFNPASGGGSGTFKASIINRNSSMLIMNESPYFITLDFGSFGGRKIIQPQHNRLLRDLDPVQDVTWLQTPDTTSALSGATVSLLGAPSAPTSTVFVEVYEPHEFVSDAWNQALSRQATVGNTVSTTGGASVELEQDVLTPFVLSGLVATRDGSNLAQLDVTAGVALIKQPDGGLGRVAPAAATFLVTVNTVYYLDLNPDGSWSWGASHSPNASALTIASVTTTSTPTILAVTDARTLNTTLLTSMAGTLNIAANGLLMTGAGGALITTPGKIQSTAAAVQGHSVISDTTLTVGTTSSLDNGAITTDGAGNITAVGETLSGALNVGGAMAKVGGIATAGGYGVAVILGRVVDFAVAATGFTNVLAATAPAGATRLVRGMLTFIVGAANTNNGVITARVSFTDPTLGASNLLFSLQTGATALNAAAVTKGTRTFTIPVFIECSPATSVTIQYDNTATGTIADTVSATIELLA